jgi:hypothetical protein
MNRTLYELGIDLEATFDLKRALSMTEACKLLRGRYGNLSRKSAIRYASPTRGCPTARPGVVLVLPTVKIAGERFTMPEWVEAFCQARVRLGLRDVTRDALPAPARSRAASIRRAEERLEREGVCVRRQEVQS